MVALARCSVLKMDSEDSASSPRMAIGVSRPPRSGQDARLGDQQRPAGVPVWAPWGPCPIARRREVQPFEGRLAGFPHGGHVGFQGLHLLGVGAYRSGRHRIASSSSGGRGVP